MIGGATSKVRPGQPERPAILQRSNHARPPEATPRSLAGGEQTSRAPLALAKIDRMSQKHTLAAILLLQALLIVAVTAALATKLLPTGVPGEWEWNRLPDSAILRWDGLSIASLGVAVYAAFVALGLRVLSTKRSHIFEAAAVLGLFFASICIQVIIPMGAPSGYDLTKWAAVNYLPGSSGYFQIAREKAATDPWKFLADYPDWIESQDVFHIGTHPPGLIVTQCLLLRVMNQNPRLTATLLDHAPATVDAGFRVFANPAVPPLSRADQAALFATALFTLFACAGTVVPLYLLARAALPAPTSWAAAALWPLAPSANLFQPVADAAYPLLSTTALALAVWAARSAHPKGPYVAASLLALASGMVMAFGMSFTLAFLPVGLIVALTLIATKSASPKARGVAHSRHRRRVLLVRFRSLGAHVRQSLRDRVLESQASCAVLRRIPANLLALDPRQLDRNDRRHRRSLRPLVLARLHRLEKRSSLSLVDAARTDLEQLDRPKHGRSGAALDALHAPSPPGRRRRDQPSRRPPDRPRGNRSPARRRNARPSGVDPGRLPGVKLAC